MLNGTHPHKREKDQLNIGDFDEEDTTSSSEIGLNTIGSRDEQKIFSIERIEEEITPSPRKSDDDSTRFKPNYDKEKSL